MDSILQIRKLNKNYSRFPALKNINLDLQAGGQVTIRGAMVNIN